MSPPRPSAPSVPTMIRGGAELPLPVHLRAQFTVRSLHQAGHADLGIAHLLLGRVLRDQRLGDLGKGQLVSLERLANLVDLGELSLAGQDLAQLDRQQRHATQGGLDIGRRRLAAVLSQEIVLGQTQAARQGHQPQRVGLGDDGTVDTLAGQHGVRRNCLVDLGADAVRSHRCRH